MRNSNGIRVVISILLLLICSSCNAQQSHHGWPEYVQNSIWVPQGAQNLRYTRDANTYQASYNIATCYPPNNMINQMTDVMKSRGWQRLTDDPVNRGQKPSHEITPGGMSWETHPWMDYWRDISGNTIFYGFRYKVSDLPLESYIRELQKSCSLEGAVAFYPAGTFKIKKEVTH